MDQIDIDARAVGRDMQVGRQHPLRIATPRCAMSDAHCGSRRARRDGSASCRCSAYRVGGRSAAISDSSSAGPGPQWGCPNADALTPGICPGWDVMSKMMLSLWL